MSRDFKLQDPGEGIHEAEIVEILVSEGDSVKQGDQVLSAETDKAITEIPSPYTGTITHIAVETGQRVQVGDLLMRFDGELDDAGEPEEEGRKPETGEGETERDSQAASPQAASHERAHEPTTATGPIPAAPSTRRLARELGVELSAVDASGPGGRVLAEDVRALAEHRGGASGERPTDFTGEPEDRAERPAPPEQETPDETRWGEVEREPLRSVRRATAREMARSWAEIPHVMHHDLADVTALERFRAAHGPDAEAAGGKLTLTVLVLKAVVAALKAFPRFNASLDSDAEAILLRRYFNIGVAVDTEQGLLVPVIRDVDRKSVLELAAELTEVAERARAGELEREEMLGGCFTLTNVGGLGGTLFTPIIRSPEAAILGLARAEWRPVIEGDPERPRFRAQLRLPLCLAFDHRLNDGADAARFMNRIITGLEDPESLLLAA